MIRSRRLASLVLVVALPALTACQATAVLRGRIRGARDITQQAEERGARNCAPRELATAQAHLEFAEVELDQGNLGRAQEHFALAEPNARAALRMSPPERCLPHEEEAPPPAPGDRDGDGILDPDDQCPDDPEDRDGVEDADGCPEDQDTDGDTITDTNDLCPFEAEDRDGTLDDDGCPEPDDDLDGILDDADRCRTEPEDHDGFEDADGCPDLDNDADRFPDATDRCPNEPGIEAEQGCPRVYQDVEVTSEGIVIHQQVFFETNRAVIRSVSFPLLDTVAQVLRDFPDITVEVQGHTDSRGRDAHNLRLSQQRADSVREYLIRAGIAPERLTARGYGETQPIETNATPDGRAANRRVEFRRTDAGARPRSAP
ncbi:OmpA family protein [Sandaracinus amylolyticus]|uniref:OmpA family protein n=1 Tax=Sandaracinus amylolyticus TaxID=927083 RepID=UPI001F17C2AE|nr:OmpA family protein [Sandaracinus amylolyticus]UJR82087.1 Outer membrane protein [Sandaracinus amylolyticus]